MGFRAHMIEKIRKLVDIYYKLPNNSTVLLHDLSDGHMFLDSNLDKVWSPITLSHLYFLISLYNSLI